MNCLACNRLKIKCTYAIVSMNDQSSNLQCRTKLRKSKSMWNLSLHFALSLVIDSSNLHNLIERRKVKNKKKNSHTHANTNTIYFTCQSFFESNFVALHFLAMISPSPFASINSCQICTFQCNVMTYYLILISFPGCCYQMIFFKWCHWTLKLCVELFLTNSSIYALWCIIYFSN